jgi:hypothetical protein
MFGKAHWKSRKISLSLVVQTVSEQENGTGSVVLDNDTFPTVFP